MGKTVVKSYVLELEAGNANINELRSTDLGSLGINLEEFCSKYNSVTNGENGIASVIIYVYLNCFPLAFIIHNPFQMRPSSVSRGMR